MATELFSVAMPAVPASGDGLRALSRPRAVDAQDPAPQAVPDLPRTISDFGSSEELATALDAIVSRAAQQGAALDFRIDDESGRVIVSLVDRRDGTVLRQMPSEEALRIARALADDSQQLIEVRA